MSETILKVAGVSKRFGGLQALSDVGIQINAEVMGGRLEYGNCRPSQFFVFPWGTSSYTESTQKQGLRFSDRLLARA